VPLSQPSAVKHSTMSFSLIVLLGVVMFLNVCSQDRTRTCIKLHIEWVST
jgi:hypothetical protein